MISVFGRIYTIIIHVLPILHILIIRVIYIFSFFSFYKLYVLTENVPALRTASRRTQLSFCIRRTVRRVARTRDRPTYNTYA